MSRKRIWLQFGAVSLCCLLIGSFVAVGCLDDPTMTMGLCADDGNPCTESNCTSGVTKHVPLPNQTACALGMNKGVCIAGTCVLQCASGPMPCPCATDAECPNSPDCKIFSCEAGRCANPLQKGCRGAPCTSDANCASNFCRDGVCCESGCNEMCKSCAVVGSLGHCEFLPIYRDDDSYTDAGYLCSAENYLSCDGHGNCLKLVGAQCGAKEECLSQVCTQILFPGAPYCRPAAGGAPCTNAEHCESKSCVNETCEAAK